MKTQSRNVQCNDVQCNDERERTMRHFVKLGLLATLAASATAASAADLEFHGYARAAIGVSSQKGNGSCFQLNTGDAKLRLGNECDWVIEPSFEMAFTKLEDKSAWGVHMTPALFTRFDDNRFQTANGDNRAAEELPVYFKEFYFFGREISQLGGGELWLGRRYFDRQYLGAINDQFLEAQDGIGAGLYNIKLGGPKLSFSLIYDPFTNGDAAAVNDRNLGIGVHVDGIQTLNKDSSLQFWGHVYVPIQVTSGPDQVAKRKTGFSASATHIAGLGSAGTLTLAARYDTNAYTDQQNSGGGGLQQIRGVAVYGVNFPSARTSLDVVGEYRHQKRIASLSDADDPDASSDWIQAGFRTDTQISGPFRFLLEAGVDSSKAKGADVGSGAGQFYGNDKRHTIFKVTPCLAINGGNDAGSRPTFRLYYTYASWNKDATSDVFAAFKDSGLASQFADKTSGGTIGLQAEGGW